ncbi:MAG: phosphoenolpyruvate synthase [Methermicoccaceae archaeon]
MARKMDNVVWLDEVNKQSISVVGGKGASLGEMIGAELPVPGGFAVTAQAFRRFITEMKIAEELFSLLEVDVDDDKQLKKAEKDAKKLVLDTEMPDKLKRDITSYYEELCRREGNEVSVAVRSSATAEDLPDASFAGQQETYLNIKGSEQVVDAVKRCWASLYGARAIFYRAKQGFDHSKVDISVIVQKMVNAEKAGVMFTSHPTSGEPNVIIEGAWGLGESVVSGSVSPDMYVVDTFKEEIVSKNISTKSIMIVRGKDGTTVEKKVPQNKRDAQVLTDGEVLRLAKLARVIEEHYGLPQDVEWGIEKGDIYILQSRPITTIKRERIETTEETAQADHTPEVVLEGIGASPGIASGAVRIVHDVSHLDKVHEGDIMVATMTTPDMVPAMKRVVGLITDEGGLTSHAAIVSRELGCPAVVGTKYATQKLKDGMTVSVDGEKGLVYVGTLKKEKEREVVESVSSAYVPITATEVKVNLSMVEATERAVAVQPDGVGLLRVEHMILGLKQHPTLYIEEGKHEEYIGELVKNIEVVVNAFYPRPVWVRTLDAPTDEFRSMKGGEREPIEHNPMLGWRGIRRDLSDTEHFKLELAAFKKLIEMGYTNIGIMLPLVQHVGELKAAKQLMVEAGIDTKKVDIGIMVEVPAAALAIEQFIEEGIDFVSFGTNDLTQYTLAVDRNNEHVSELYDEMHPAILYLIEHVIERCRKAGVQTSICGQAGSNPEMARRLVEFGITSISANIDAVEAVRNTVMRTERQLMLDALRKQG